MRDSVISTTTNDSLHGIKDGFHPGFHFPVVTFALSSYRELRLLHEQRTEIEKVLKHVTLDVAAVGGAGFLGMKTGALLLSWLGPVGAAIGGLVGGIGGAITGKMGANAVRFASFDQAKAEYSTTVEAAKDAIQRRLETSQGEIRNLQRQFGARYEQERSEIIKQAGNGLAAIQRKLATEIDHFIEQFPDRLDQLQAQLITEQRELLGSIPASLFGLLVPTEFDLIRSAIKRWFRQARLQVKEEKKSYLALTDRSTENLLREIRRFLHSYEFELASLANDIQGVSDGLERNRKDADGIRNSAIGAVEDLRTRLVKEFSDQVESVHRDIGNIIKHWHDSVERCKEALLREARPVGLDDRLRPLIGGSSPAAMDGQ